MQNSIAALIKSSLVYSIIYGEISQAFSRSFSAAINKIGQKNRTEQNPAQKPLTDLKKSSIIKKNIQANK